MSYHIEFVRAGSDEIERVSVVAVSWFQAQQIVIGRYAPVFLRRFNAEV